MSTTQKPVALVTSLLLAATILTVLNACHVGHHDHRAEAIKGDGKAAQVPIPIASIYDVMSNIVDPNADEIWDSVGTEVTSHGEVNRHPKTDAEWQALRRKAITLTEAANLLAQEGRHVVNPGQVTADAHIQGVLGPEGIEHAINQDFPAFQAKAAIFQQAALKTLHAIDQHDADQLVSVGGQLERSCEGCHVAYWYPKGAKPDHTS